MRHIAFLILIICAQSREGAFCQISKKMPFDKNQKIQVRLLDNEVLSNDTGFDLRFLISNKTDTSFILYGFKVIGGGSSNKALFTQSEITAGSELFPTDKKGKWVKLELNGEVQKMINSDIKHRYTWKQAVDVIYKNTVTLKSRSTEEIKVHIPLVKGTLKKGQYNLYFIYYSGVNVTNIVEQQTVQSDEKKNNALLYQGYVESNTVKLIVK